MSRNDAPPIAAALDNAQLILIRALDGPLAGGAGSLDTIREKAAEVIAGYLDALHTPTIERAVLAMPHPPGAIMLGDVRRTIEAIRPEVTR